MKLGDFLKIMAAKLGQQDNAELAALIAAVGTNDIPDTLATTFDTGLMSLDGAKLNTSLQNHFKPTYLAPVDAQFKTLAEKYGIADAMEAEKNTYKKAAILEAELVRRIAEAEAKGNSGDSAKQITALNDQIKGLQGQLATLTTKSADDIAALKKSHATEIVGMLIKGELNGKNYAIKGVDKSINVMTAENLLRQQLAKDKAVVVVENGELKLKQSENPTMDYVDSGYRTVAFSDYANKLLADSKLLEVTEPAKTQPQGGTQPQGNAPVVSGAMASAIAASMNQN